MTRAEGDRGSAQTIVVPLDGSAFAEQALGQAQALASATRATLVLVTVVPMLEDIALAEAGVVPAWVETERQAEVEDLRRYLACIRSQFSRAALLLAGVIL